MEKKLVSDGHMAVTQQVLATAFISINNRTVMPESFQGQKHKGTTASNLSKNNLQKMLCQFLCFWKCRMAGKTTTVEIQI